ncbi:amidase family protein [Rhodococcus sp. 3Y1]
MQHFSPGARRRPRRSTARRSSSVTREAHTSTRVDRPDSRSRARREIRLPQGERIAATVNQVFDTFDLVLMPTTPALPRPIGQLEGTGLLSAVRKALPIAAYCSIWNVCGNPAAAVPAGFSERGLP